MKHHGQQVRLFVPDALLIDADVRRGWGVLAREGRIAAVGPGEELARRAPDAERVELPGYLLMAGTVNAHSHSFQSLLRGLGDDRPYF